MGRDLPGGHVGGGRWLQWWSGSIVWASWMVVVVVVGIGLRDVGDTQIKCCSIYVTMPQQD